MNGLSFFGMGFQKSRTLIEKSSCLVGLTLLVRCPHSRGGGWSKQHTARDKRREEVGGQGTSFQAWGTFHQASSWQPAVTRTERRTMKPNRIGSLNACMKETSSPSPRNFWRGGSSFLRDQGRAGAASANAQSKEGMYVVRADGRFFSARKYEVYAELIPTVIKKIKRTSVTLFSSW